VSVAITVIVWLRAVRAAVFNWYEYPTLGHPTRFG
jgi:hypothetical protein